MSIYFSGSFTRSGGLMSAIVKHRKAVNLKNVKKIEVKFDPFHPNAITARDFLFHISTPPVTNTNLNCAIKPNVVCDRSEPEIKVHLEKGNVKFLAGNLSIVEILQLFNKHISSKVPPAEPVNAKTSKIEKKKQKQKR